MKAGIRPENGPFIPAGEILIRASRSSGPGGQHANVTASRIEAVFAVRDSVALTDTQKARIERKLGPVVTAIAQDARSQARNRDLALERLEAKLGEALAVPKRRRPTKPSRTARQKRLTGKKIRSQTKRNRRPPREDE
ncbi:MAG TPA: alternative ribosome rescue aminoacyl-tRNA hydrolase ArfB [Solirubrobacterales bacterium]|nr:alternative ribosome rescue aminoacyl-tRNA hydrolase ArfB [Solirubrobacterales bacterium]